MRSFQPAIEENTKDNLIHQVKELMELLSDLDVAIDNLNLSEEQLEIIEPVTTKIGVSTSDIQDVIYFT